MSEETAENQDLELEQNGEVLTEEKGENININVIPGSSRSNSGSEQKASSFGDKGIFGPGGFLDSVEAEVNFSSSSCPCSSVISTSTTFASATTTTGTNVVLTTAENNKQVLPEKKFKLEVYSDEASEVPVHDIALSIDHILELVLRGMNTRQLKNARLVCRRWKVLASREMQKRCEINFRYITGLANTNPGYHIVKVKHWGSTTTTNYSLDAVSADMQDSDFPCNKFGFLCLQPDRSIDIQLNTPRLQNFLTDYGFFIKHVNFNLAYNRQGIKAEQYLLNDIRQLLLCQLPNLHTLKLSIRMSSEWTNAPASVRQMHRDKDPLETRPPYALHRKLKVVDIYEDVPEGLLQDIVSLAPNLQEFNVNARHVRLLIEPVNRIHLLKSATLEPPSLRNEFLAPFKFLANNPHIFMPREITIWGGRDWPLIQRNILERCCSFLEKMQWINVFVRFWGSGSGGSVENGNKIPVMPKMRSLQINSVNCSRPQQFFPGGLNWAQTFPALESISLVNKRHPMAMGPFRRAMEVPEYFIPVPSVRYVRLKKSSPNNNSQRGEQQEYSTEFVQELSAMFPNARVLKE